VSQAGRGRLHSSDTCW